MSLQSLLNEFQQSIKSYDTEEKLDLYFYRPFGFLIAKVALRLKMNPSELSILGALSAFLAAFIFSGHPTSTLGLNLIGIFFFLLSGIFDSSDGQLARLGNLSTPMGIVIDGICDSLATIAVYIGFTWPFLTPDQWYWIPFLVAALLSHSYQASILDFYHREYLCFGLGKAQGTYWNPGTEEMDEEIEKSMGFDKFLNKLRKTWVKQQQRLTTRSLEKRKNMRSVILGTDHLKAQALMLEYKRLNLKMLTLWRSIGTNAHTVLSILFLLSGHIEYYFFSNIVVLNALIWVIGRIQRKQDDELFSLFPEV